VTSGRMEAFSDGVIAILITIMVLELRQPHGATFTALRHTFPSLLAYALSFVNIGIYWMNHHHLVKTVRRYTGSILWANLNLLFWLSLFPFVTRWMASNGFARNTVATYAVVATMAAIAFTILQTVIVRSYGADLSLKLAVGRDLKAKLCMFGYVIAIPLAFAFRWVSIAIFIAVALTWLLPDRRYREFLASTSTDSDTA
jgi:uncharacterized membrane protein